MPRSKRATTAKKKKQSRPRTVTIAHRSVSVTELIDGFYEWMAERDRIRRKRQAGEPRPWSEDKVFNEQPSCNVFRIYDRGSQFMLNEVINKGDQDHTEVCFRVILYKLFNRPDTWTILEEGLDTISWASFDVEEYERVLGDALKGESSIYCNGYYIPAPKFGWDANYKNHLRLLKLMMEQDLPGELLKRRHMREAFELVSIYPSLGPFLAFQLVLDLNMTPHLKFAENEWAICGPGSKEGLAKIFGPDVRGIEPEAIAYLYQSQDVHWERLGIDNMPTICDGYTGINMVDIEHSLCEYTKYLRFAKPGTSGRRKSIRNVKWVPKDLPLTHNLPGHDWLRAVFSNTSDDFDTVSHADSDWAEMSDNEYEVSHIVNERENKGRAEYKIRWTGYGPEEDTWFTKKDLKDAPELIRKWKEKLSFKNDLESRIADL